MPLVPTNTYIIAMYHCSDALSAAAENKDSPMSVIVGVIARGPMNFSMKPMMPENPIRT